MGGNLFHSFGQFNLATGESAKILRGHGNAVHACTFSPDGKFVEIAELPSHPWFLAVQFHPEFQSKPLTPHPLFASFVEAAYRHKTDKLAPVGVSAVGSRQ